MSEPVILTQQLFENFKNFLPPLFVSLIPPNADAALVFLCKTFDNPVSRLPVRLHLMLNVLLN
jgi:hypothetical protein